MSPTFNQRAVPHQSRSGNRSTGLCLVTRRAAAPPMIPLSGRSRLLQVEALEQATRRRCLSGFGCAWCRLDPGSR
ncbi:hypothetical protein B0T14DRAFT_265568 [Immersiella caudata]|uniref:Uncharacterized protein n=1 Tax=Immersiella caudata TaxID=314043 RepID=A0AA40BXF6_9PEZI|nr:hypothetical protein B0T14DRAFT_265568 [Immersiella caudata]